MINAEICKDFRFEAAHFLPNVPKNHQCHQIHGHSFKITIRLNGPLDEKQGWVMDFFEINQIVSPVINQLDHKLLNNIPGLENPTSEIIALWIFRQLEKNLPLLSSVTLRSTERVSVTINKS
jgi:6-pyruvoyltetrahydropterin/6-carboxytetrahydropterin synthase